MKKDLRFSQIIPLAALSLLCLGALHWPAPAKAYLPPGEPTYFAGNPFTSQLAFRYRIGLRVLGWTGDRTGLYGLFSQSSFWFLDNEDRGYTVENDFEPEVQFFADGTLLAKAAGWWPRQLDFSLSYSHLSDWLDGPLSRSWNHINGGLYLGDPDVEPLSGSLIGWFPFNVESSNQDIASYAGHGKITVYFRPHKLLPVIGRTQLYLATHFSFDSSTGGFFTNLETSWSFAPRWLWHPPFPGPGKDGHQPESDFGFFVQWVIGRGESLIEYQQYQNTLRFGLVLW